MDRKKITSYALIGAAILLAVAYVGCAFSYRSDCIRAENGIKAQYDQDRNNYDNMWKRFREMSQVPEAYAADLQKVYDSVIQKRYGDTGAKAAIQFITEHNPNFDGSLYRQLESAIEAGRTSFAADQQQLIDKRRQYENVLGGTRALFVNVWFGFPHIDLTKYDIVTSVQTEKAFQDKKADEIQLRPQP